MVRQIRRVVFVATLLLISGITYSHSTAGPGTSPLEGTWEGKLEVAYSSSTNPDSEKRAKAAYAKSSFRIRIVGQRASVFFGGEEVKPGSFQYQAYMTNAVIFASSTGEDRDGRWVETWNFTLTEKNSKTMIACLSRVVNNLDLAETKDDGKFGLLAAGDFHRISN